MWIWQKENSGTTNTSIRKKRGNMGMDSRAEMEMSSANEASVIRHPAFPVPGC